MRPFLLVDLFPAQSVHFGLYFCLFVEDPLVRLDPFAVQQRQQQFVAYFHWLFDEQDIVVAVRVDYQDKMLLF
jgi:hypothetical protein